MRQRKTLADFEELLSVRRLSLDPPTCGRNTTPQDVERARASLDERRERLDNVLRCLAGAVRDRVYKILQKAKREEWRSYLNGFEIDQRRRFKEDQEELRTALRCINRVNATWLDNKFHRMHKVTDSMLEVQWPGAVRRSRVGHQPQPWLKEADESLARLGVPKERRKDLLVAVGLSRPRGSDLEEKL